LFLSSGKEANPRKKTTKEKEEGEDY